MLGHAETVVARIGTGPAHLARRVRGGVRLACRPTLVAPERVTVMARVCWLAKDRWRKCDHCKTRAKTAKTDKELFA